MSRRIGHITIALATLVLSGCGADNPAPPPLPTASQSDSPTAATPPVMPDSARGTTRAAAKEFVTYYVAVMDYSARTLDTSLLESASAKTCDSCQSIVQTIDELRTAGGSFVSEPMVVNRVVFRSTAPDGTLAIVAHVTVPKQTLVPSPSASPQVTSGDVDSRHFFNVRYDASGWLVTRLDIK